MRLRAIPIVLGAAALAASLHPATAAVAVADPLLAPAAACPGQKEAAAPLRIQRRAMRCLTNAARARAGLGRLREAGGLDLSARLKSRDILRCDQFEHEACGREFSFWIHRVGYLDSGCGRLGENIAYGTGPLGTPRSIFAAWLASEGHRENILGPYRELGIGLRVGSLGDVAQAHVWTQHFGARC